MWAKELIELEKFEDSVVFSKLAYRIAFKYVRDRIGIFKEYPGIHLSDWIYEDLDHNVAYDDEELQAFKDSVYRGFRMILSGMEDIVVQLQTVGKAGGLHNYMSMEHKIPEISLNESGVKIHETMSGFIPKKSEAEEVRNYVLDCIIAWQEVGIHPKWVEEDLKYFEWAKNQIEAKRKEASK
ncbi:MAG: hypothetical protein U9Q76_01115 [candidate division WOR-3 bacterium]|nr:hypothetical protein [candidate division WOR-3 bacterium]